MGWHPLQCTDPFCLWFTEGGAYQRRTHYRRSDGCTSPLLRRGSLHQRAAHQRGHVCWHAYDCQRVRMSCHSCGRVSTALLCCCRCCCCWLPLLLLVLLLLLLLLLLHVLHSIKQARCHQRKR